MRNIVDDLEQFLLLSRQFLFLLGIAGCGIFTTYM